RWVETYIERGIPVEWGSVMTAFGCYHQGDISAADVLKTVRALRTLVTEAGSNLSRLYLADTVGWGTPSAVERLIGVVREEWPEVSLALQLHDTRGTGLANAYAALRLGVDQFDASCAGLGGCPFAGHKGAAGNICTEDMVFMCDEMGVATGIDLEKLIECAHMAEEIVGHPLPGKVMRGGSLARYRQLAGAQ